MREIEKKLSSLIFEAASLGLSDTDRKNAEVALENFEYAISLDIVTEQLYEYDVKITPEFLRHVDDICDLMDVERGKYGFLNELLRQDDIFGRAQ
jgi:hypothetical protein